MISPRNTRKYAKRGIGGTGAIAFSRVTRLYGLLDSVAPAEGIFLSRPFAFFAGLNMVGNS